MYKAVAGFIYTSVIRMKPPPKNQTQSWKLNLLVSAFSLLLVASVIGGSEWLLRRRLWQKVGQDREAYEVVRRQQSGQVGYFFGQPDQHHVFHPLGFKKSRWSQFRAQRPPGQASFRALVLGGSAVAGSEYILGWDFVAVAERMLQVQNPDLDVVLVNGGIWGGTSGFERLQSFHLRHYGFDAVVIYSGYNDLYGYAMDRAKYLQDLAYFDQRLGFRGRLGFYLKENSLAYEWLTQHMPVLKKTYPLGVTAKASRRPLDFSEASRQELNGLVMRQLRHTLEVTQAQNLPVYFMFQSSYSALVLQHPLSELEQQLMRDHLGDQLDYWLKVMAFYAPALEQATRDLCSQFPHVRYVNSADFAKAYPVLFYDDVHFDGKGMLIFGNQLAQDLQKYVLQRSVENWKNFVLRQDADIVVVGQ